MLTDGGGERIQEFHNSSDDVSLSQLSLGGSPPVQLAPLGQQQEVPGPIMTKEGLVAAIAELTAAQDAAAAKKDFLGAEHYRVQILQ